MMFNAIKHVWKGSLEASPGQILYKIEAASHEDAIVALTHDLIEGGEISPHADYSIITVDQGIMAGDFVLVVDDCLSHYVRAVNPKEFH